MIHIGFLTLSLLPSQVLPHDSKARRLFVTSGGLKKVQEIQAEPGSLLQEHINAINSCFPEEIVRCEPDKKTQPQNKPTTSQTKKKKI